MSDVKYLCKSRLIERVEKLNDIYWNKSWLGRWKYMYFVVNELKRFNPQTILELGAYQINLTDISDNMDLKLDRIDVNNLKNKTYVQDAIDLPWNILDKHYDVFVALQVFEHLKNEKQSEVFSEISRISKNAILSFPYKWNCPSNITHHNITDETIRKWTNNQIPEKIICTTGEKKRIIYIFKY